jgi:methyl-accepting chemotaxis protein
VEFEPSFLGEEKSLSFLHDSSELEPDEGEELPMIVSLNEDESLVASFSMSADDVMQVLNIKRSRLTQISGRELRVGRLRVDKYVRPFYRPCDVEKYKEWTRATASHQSSAKALNEVVDRFDKQLGAIKDDLKDPLWEVKDCLQSSFSLAFQNVVQLLRRDFALTQRQFSGLLQQLTELGGSMDQQAQKNTVNFDQLAQGLRWFVGRLNHMNKELSDVASAANALSASLKNISHEVNELSDKQLHCQNQLERLLALGERIQLTQQELMPALMENKEALSRDMMNLEKRLEQRQAHDNAALSDRLMQLEESIKQLAAVQAGAHKRLPGKKRYFKRSVSSFEGAAHDDSPC